MEALKISFCTTCMDRLHHLRKTLPQNIIDNADYTNAEFVILNYNSKDNLENWIKKEYIDYIRNGRVVYAKVNEPKYFHMSHAKNLAAKCSSGDIICNVDADNFTGKNFAKYINDVFLSHKSILLNTDTSRSPRDVCGRIAIKRKDFFELGGYNEEMKGWGYEEADLKQRLLTKGIKFIPIDTAYLNFISHENNERTQNEELFHKIEQVWIKKMNERETEIIYFFNNDKFHLGTIVKESIDKPNSPSFLKKGVWFEGRFAFEDCGARAILTDSNGNFLKEISSTERSKIANANHMKTFYRISDTKILENIKHAYSILTNYSIMRRKSSRNSLKKDILVKKDLVFFNFSSHPKMI